MLDKIPNPVSGFELEEIDGEILLYSPSATRSVYLNSTASLIWRLCDGRNTVGQIIDILSQAYPDAEEDMERDVSQSIEQFMENGAISLDRPS